jgi:hypothetical protein
MNERIKELAEQAGLTTVADVYLMKKYMPNEVKFAELIVQECANIARNVGNISEPDDWALDRCYEIEQRIQDRFGVEE